MRHKLTEKQKEIIVEFCKELIKIPTTKRVLAIEDSFGDEKIYIFTDLDSLASSKVKEYYRLESKFMNRYDDSPNIEIFLEGDIEEHGGIDCLIGSDYKLVIYDSKNEENKTKEYSKEEIFKELNYKLFSIVNTKRIAIIEQDKHFQVVILTYTDVVNSNKEQYKRYMKLNKDFIDKHEIFFSFIFCTNEDYFDELENIVFDSKNRSIYKKPIEVQNIVNFIKLRLERSPSVKYVFSMKLLNPDEYFFHVGFEENVSPRDIIACNLLKNQLENKFKDFKFRFGMSIFDSNKNENTYKKQNEESEIDCLLYYHSIDNYDYIFLY